VKVIAVAAAGAPAPAAEESGSMKEDYWGDPNALLAKLTHMGV
jgi:hypothetical protein